MVAADCRVSVLDNLSSGCIENLADCQGDINFIQGDIRDERTLSKAVAGCNVVFHLAAQVSVPRSFENPEESADINDKGTLQVLEAARQGNVRRVVLSSSCAVYGDPAEMPVNENTPASPLSPYAAHKLAGEKHAPDYSRSYALETVCLRYFNVFGPRQDPSSPYSGVISIFLDRVNAGQRPVIHGDGEQSRDFIYVADVVKANLAAAVHSDVSEKAFNIGTGCQTTINQLWGEIGKLMRASLVPEYKPARDGDIRKSFADTVLAEEKLGFKAQTSLEKGLKLTYDWYLEKEGGY